MPSTIRLHRVLRAKPERVYRAFIDPAAMCKWLPPHGFTGTVHEMDANVGGSCRMSFTNCAAGKRHAFGGQFLELVPSARPRYTDGLDDRNLPGEMEAAVALKPVSVGTELEIVQAGVPDAIPPEACHLGRQESLTLPAQLVEPEIPGRRRGARQSIASTSVAARAKSTSSSDCAAAASSARMRA